MVRCLILLLGLLLVGCSDPRDPAEAEVAFDPPLPAELARSFQIAAGPRLPLLTPKALVARMAPRASRTPPILDLV